MSVHEDLLVSDFHECFAQMRHYDDGFRDVVKFGFEGVFAVITGYAFLAGKYGFADWAGVGLALLTLLATLMGSLLVIWLARNRVYYAHVCRYVNEIRSAYISAVPGGVSNKAGMYVNYARPLIFNPASTQTLQVYFLSLSTALLFAGFVGTCSIVHAVGHGSKPTVNWCWVILTFLLFSAIEVGGVLIYWAHKEKRMNAQRSASSGKSGA